MAQRIKGLEVVMNVIIDGKLEARLDKIQNFEMVYNQEVTEEEYIGETEPDFDEISKGMSVSWDMHMSNQQAFIVAEQIKLRARRRAGGANRFDLMGEFLFPNGDRPIIAIPDVFFGDVPFTIGGRSDYVQAHFEGRAKTFKRI